MPENGGGEITPERNRNAVTRLRKELGAATASVSAAATVKEQVSEHELIAEAIREAAKEISLALREVGGLLASNR
jgi:hypothetical protein